MADGGEVEGIPLVPGPSAKELNQRQIVDYREHRRELVNWLLHLGKDPERAKGYAKRTARRRACDLDVWYRWIWDSEGRYTTGLTHEHADDYMQSLAYSDHSDSHKANIQKSLKCFWRWQQDPWDPSITFNGQGRPQQPPDYLTREERRLIREAALAYGSVPHYNSLTPEARERWKAHLAMRFRKPAGRVSREDFERANGFKIPSIVNVSLDAALRPVEVGRARLSWVDVDNALLRIPAEDAAKSDQHWVVSLQQSTARMLEQWIQEREMYDRYTDTDKLWLTRENRPYSSRSLKHVLHRLCEIAGIDTENRRMTWYVLRHSTGTYLSREDGLTSAAAQLRHQSIETTARYDHAPADERRAALERLD